MAVADSRALRRPHRLPELSLRGRFAPVAISGRQLRFRRKYPIIRPSTARFPRRFAPRNDTSGERAVHQCTCAVELPSARCSGNAAAFPIGAISRFLRKKIPEAQASGSFSLSKKSLWAFSPSCFQNCKIEFCCILFCNSAAAAGDGTRKETLTVSFHTFLPSETFG